MVIVKFLHCKCQLIKEDIPLFLDLYIQSIGTLKICHTCKYTDTCEAKHKIEQDLTGDQVNP